MSVAVLKVSPQDNVLVALQDLKAGNEITFESESYILPFDVPAKHKFVMTDLNVGDPIYMYGVLVGKAKHAIGRGGIITTENTQHAAAPFSIGERKLDWHKPDIAHFEGRTFNGFYRTDDRVGTANYWIVVPLVFCQNYNLEVIKEAFEQELGYAKPGAWNGQVKKLKALYQSGADVATILEAHLSPENNAEADKLFPNVDGIRFLEHIGGCGGTREDSDSLCALLAGYITHPNVAGATVLSLGCQHAQASILQEEIKKRSPHFDKPLFVLEQQQFGNNELLLAEALKQTFAGLMQANQQTRRPAPLSKLCIGLECGGSDGFSGISANPVLGYMSDILVQLDGSVILAEFPELCGVEQDLSDRCVDVPTAQRFSQLMKSYSDRAEAVGSGFDMNPSPGNIKDGLITDAIKSAGAAKKGGASPVTDVLDYPEIVSKSGLNLLCTPGSDVESTTAEVAAGANIVLFTTGLGTPTGNPIVPVMKISSNTSLYNKMNDIIDFNAGDVIEGKISVADKATELLDYVIDVASGKETVAAVRRGQEDFIPWKRGVSL